MFSVSVRGLETDRGRRRWPGSVGRAQSPLVVGPRPVGNVLPIVGFAGSLANELLVLIRSDGDQIMESVAKHKIAERGFDPRAFGL